MVVFLGIESVDHEGDPDVLAAFYRLGLRSIQFATESGFNAFSDSALAATQGGRRPITTTASMSAGARCCGG
jgi:membrane dipeptidase